MNKEIFGGPEGGSGEEGETMLRTRKLDIENWHVVCERAHETRAWNYMLILAIQRTSEMQVREFGDAGRRPIRVVDTDGVGNGVPVRVDGIVIDGDGWTADIEEYVGLQVYLIPDIEIEGMHKPEGSRRIVNGQGFQSWAVSWVNGAKTKSAASTSQVEKRSEDGSVQLILDKLDERGRLVRNFGGEIVSHQGGRFPLLCCQSTYLNFQLAIPMPEARRYRTSRPVRFALRRIAC